jgi:hypothetical protein
LLKGGQAEGKADRSVRGKKKARLRMGQIELSERGKGKDKIGGG